MVFSPTIANRLLSGLPAADLEQLRRHLVPVRLVRGQVLIERGQAAEHIFFIEDGIAALMAQTDDGKPAVQVAMIGREGMVGGLALLDGASPPYAGVVMQLPGGALRIAVAQLRRCMDDSPAVRDAAMRFVQSLTRQIMETAAWNASRTLRERCVHWLLMAHERVEGDDLPVTHEALSALLGVRRSGVTVTMAALQEEGLVRISRGRIRVMDRAGLALLADGAGPRGRCPPAPQPPASQPHASGVPAGGVVDRNDVHAGLVIEDAILHAPGHAGHVASRPSVR